MRKSETVYHVFSMGETQKKHIPSTCHEYPIGGRDLSIFFQCKIWQVCSLVTWSNTFFLFSLQRGDLAKIPQSPWKVEISHQNWKNGVGDLSRSFGLFNFFMEMIWSDFIATENTSFRSPNGGFVMEIPLFQGNLGWWYIICWPEWYTCLFSWSICPLILFLWISSFQPANHSFIHASILLIFSVQYVYSDVCITYMYQRS